MMQPAATPNPVLPFGADSWQVPVCLDSRTKVPGECDAAFGPTATMCLNSKTRLPTTLDVCQEEFSRTFFPDSRSLVAMTEKPGAPRAAIPLLIRQVPGIALACLPVNPWMKCSDLLVSPEPDAAPDFEALAVAVLDAGAALHDFDWVCDDDGWDQLIAAFRQLGCHVDRRFQFEVGTLCIEGDWNAYWQSRSASHRKNMQAAWKRLQRMGTVTFERHRHIPLELRDQLFEEVFSLEHMGWKGEKGTSVRAHPPVERFYRKIGAILNDPGLLELQFLRVDGRAIAFEWGYRNAGVYYSHKVSYHPEFAKFSPGQLLMYRQLEEFFRGGDTRFVDTMGELSEATARWTTGKYTVQRYRVSSPRLLSRLALKAACSGREIANGVRRLLRR